MILIACLEAIALVAIVHFSLRTLESQQTAHSAQHDAWREERRELLERIQRPEVMPIVRANGFEFPETEPDDSHLVGTVQFPPEE